MLCKAYKVVCRGINISNDFFASVSLVRNPKYTDGLVPSRSVNKSDNFHSNLIRSLGSPDKAFDIVKFHNFDDPTRLITLCKFQSQEDILSHVKFKVIPDVDDLWYSIRKENGDIKFHIDDVVRDIRDYLLGDENYCNSCVVTSITPLTDEEIKEF